MAVHHGGRGPGHISRRPGPASTEPRISLSASSILESAASGSTVGVLSVVNHPSGSSGWTFVETADPDNKFAVSGANLNTSAALNWETATSHSVTIQANNGVDTPISRTFTITVTNVLEVTLSALSFSDTQWALSTPDIGTITGKSGGSTVAVVGSLPSGLTLDLLAMTWSWSGAGSVSTGSFTLRETHPDGNNSPRDTVINWQIVAAPAPSAINAPYLEITSQTVYPPPLFIWLDETVHEDDVLEFQADDAFAFASPSIDEEVVLDAAAIAEDDLSIPGVSGISSPDLTYFRARVRRGAEYSAWAYAVHGETTAPTITSSDTGSANEGPTIGTVTADQPVVFTTSGGVDQAYFSVDPAVGTSATWDITPDPVYSTKSSYSVRWQATNLAGLVSTQDYTHTVLDIDGDGPVWASGATASAGNNNTLAYLMAATDALSPPVSYSIVGGADAAQFETSGTTLRWVSNGTKAYTPGGDNDYVVTLRATDSLGYYTDLTVTVTVLAYSLSSLSSYYSGGIAGMVWDLTDSNTLFQDIAGTTPVTAAGQPVGKIIDVSGNGNHWTASANDSTRPTYQVDGDSKPYLDFSGAQYLIAPTPFMNNTSRVMTAVFGIYAATNSAQNTLLGCSSTSSANPFVMMSTWTSIPQFDLRVRNDANGESAITSRASMLNSTKRVMTSQLHSAGGKVRNAASRPAGGGDGAYATQSYTLSGTFTFTRAGMGCRPIATPTAFYTGRIYSGAAINSALDDAAVKVFEDWAAARNLTSALP